MPHLPRIFRRRSSHGEYQQLPQDGDGNDNDIEAPHNFTVDIPSPASSRNGDVVANESSLSSSGEITNSQKLSGRRRVTLERAQQLNAPEDGSLTRMGKVYDKIVTFSVATRYLIYIFPLGLLLAVPIIFGATRHDVRIGGVPMVWLFTWIEVVWLSLWVSKAVAHYIPLVFQFLCRKVSPGTRKYALVLSALETPISLVGWSLASLATFVPLVSSNPDKESGDTTVRPWQDVFKKILMATMVSTLLLAAEKALVQLISVSHHRKRFDTKIQESKKNIRLMTILYEASLKLFPEYCEDFEEEDCMMADSITRVGKKGHSRTGSVSPMRLIQEVGRLGDKNSAHSVVVLALEKQKSSEALARRLWLSCVLQDRDALYREDLIEMFGPGRDTEAEECFTLLDRDQNDDVSLEEMILTITDLGIERQSITKSTHDVGQAIRVLDHLLCIVVFIVAVLVFIAFLNDGFGTVLAAGVTTLVSLSFVFSSSAQDVLASCIFLFVKHPYDVGDRVDIAGRTLIVERISLLHTKFRSVLDYRTIQAPNTLLAQNWTENISQSKAMREQVVIVVDPRTTFVEIEMLKNELEKFVRDQENSRDFQPTINIDVLELGEMNKLQLGIEIHHKSNWANEAIRATRRTKFMCALLTAVRKVPIYGPGKAILGNATNPTYWTTISDHDAQQNRDKFAAEKKSKEEALGGELESIIAPESRPTSQAKSTGFEPFDPSNNGMGHPASPAAASITRPPSDVAVPREPTFVDTLNPRVAGINRGQSSGFNAYSSLSRKPSGRRRAYTHSPLVSSNLAPIQQQQEYDPPDSPVSGHQSGSIPSQPERLSFSATPRSLSFVQRSPLAGPASGAPRHEADH
ncbi:hypothetical protein FQN54_006635 [Arachnomyces sp. PD_36]|nr:hypothetical protein FQN54_006635 [Arachnomyces sp. PD_36]